MHISLLCILIRKSHHKIKIYYNHQANNQHINNIQKCKRFNIKCFRKETDENICDEYFNMNIS